MSAAEGIPPRPLAAIRPLLIVLILASSLLALMAGTALAQEEQPVGPLNHPGEPLPMDGSAPGHLPRPAVPPFTPALAAPLPPPREHDRIVYAFKAPARSLMTYDAGLSAACRRGRFLQRIDLAYRAFGPGERPLGVAYGTMAINLVDPDRHRAAGMVYFFDKQDTGLCAVYTARQDVIRPWFVGP